MSVSSHTLFHFVSERKYLEDILNKDFYPRYCLESFGFKFAHMKKAHILMKCFCDIPLHNIIKHTMIYGCYGIGFTKEWGVRMGINPILYLNKQSPFFEILDKTVRKRMDAAKLQYDSKKIDKDEFVEELFEPLSSISFIKPISGRMYREKSYKNVYFYDEREWRYVPLKIFDLQSGKQRVNKLLVLTDDLVGEKDKLQMIARETMKIEFQVSDVKYIFLKEEADKEYMTNWILEAQQYEEADKIKLISKIITIKQIKEDF